MISLPTHCPVCEQESLIVIHGELVCPRCNGFSRRLFFKERVLFWAEGRGWWWRALILAGFGYTFWQQLKHADYALNRLANPLSAMDFGIHELGHIIFIPLGQFMTILGGSLFQCLFPLFWLAAFAAKRSYFTVSMCLCWFGFNLFDVAYYADDARTRQIPLVSLGDNYDKAHDWYQILSRLHHLELDHTIAYILRLAGTLTFTLGLAFGALLVLLMLLTATRNLVTRLNKSRKKL